MRALRAALVLLAAVWVRVRRREGNTVWAAPLLVPAVLALWGGSALAGGAGQTLAFPTLCYAGACASASGSATLYADAIAYSLHVSTDCGEGTVWGQYCSQAVFGGFAATGGRPYRLAVSGLSGLVTAPAGVAGQLSVRETVSWCGLGGGCTRVDGPVTYSAAVATISPAARLSFQPAASPDQTAVWLDSNLYEAASWTLQQQRLGPAGHVAGTTSYALSTGAQGGSTGWTSADQSAGWTYRYSATTVASIAGSQVAEAIVFPVAAPPVATAATTAVSLSWSALYAAGGYQVEAQRCASPAASQPPQGCAAWAAWQALGGPTQGTSRTVTDFGGAPLRPDSLYRFAVAPAMPDGGTAWPQASAGVWTPALPPGSPGAAGTATSLTESWSPAGNPAGAWFEAQLAPAGDSGTAQVRYTQSSSAVFSGLDCQSDYTLSVQAVSGSGAASAPVSLQAETGVCPPPPLVALQIDGGARSTAQGRVALAVSASDLSFPQSQLRMRFSDDASSWSAWAPFAPRAAWTLTAAGLDTVYAQVEDPGGALGQAEATIVYAPADGADAPATAGPKIAFDGVTATDVGDPRVTAAFAPPAGAVSMSHSLDGVSWSPPQPAGSSVSVVLPAADGLHPVYDRYQDGQGDPLGTQVDYFVLDTTPPSLGLSWLDGAAATDGGAQTLVVAASDDVSPAGSLHVAVTGGASWSGLLPAGGDIPLSFAAGGYQVVTVTVTDQAGNAASGQLGIYNP